MSAPAIAAAAACAAMGASLLTLAWRRLGVARRVLRAVEPVQERDGVSAGARDLVGVIEPDGALVVAPFTDRPVLYVRAVLRGVGPNGGAPRVLWEKVLVAPAKLLGENGAALPIQLEGARVLLPREYRYGALRALVPEVRLLPRVLSRVGYKKPPPSRQFFQLEEEVILPGQRVFVLGERGERGELGGGAQGSLVVSNLTRGRVVLRAAWGPAFAAMLAMIILITGGTVVGTWLWLR